MVTTSSSPSREISPIPGQSLPSFSIKPIVGREATQRNFVALPQRAAAFSGRKLTLNERFGIIERGYFLDLKDDYILQLPSTERNVELTLRSDKLKKLQGEELKQHLREEMEKRKAKVAKKSEAKSESSSATSSP